VYERITNKIIAELEAGDVPWLKPWNVGAARKHGSSGSLGDIWPRNAISNHWYSGYNVLACWGHLQDIKQEGSQPLFLTYKQAREHGGTVRKGERGCMLVAYGHGKYITEDANGEEKTKTWRKAFAHYVFHISQCDDVKLPEKRAVDTSAAVGLEDDAQWQKFIKATGATIKHGGGEAYYRPSSDHVQMPAAKHFKGPWAYKAVTVHELTHWTGHKKRLDRDQTGSFGSKPYAFEELVAELGAAFLCARLGIVHKELRHAGYIKTWIGALKFDKMFIVQAASKAGKAANFIAELTAEALKPEKKHAKTSTARNTKDSQRAKRASRKGSTTAKPPPDATSPRTRQSIKQHRSSQDDKAVPRI
jgi:antirestriction protein ArdC